MKEYRFKNRLTGEIRPVNARSLDEAYGLLKDFLHIRYDLIDITKEE